MIDSKMIPDSPDVWLKPDTDEPRSTQDFINHTWLCRHNPVYALRPTELTILQSKTMRGWLWRLVMKLFRYSRPSDITLQAYMDGPIPVEDITPPVHAPESERTMEHYLTVAKKFTPELSPPLPPPDPNSCGCSCCHEIPPKKPKKKGRKKLVKKPKKK
jgi:hypothetical protein